MAAQEAPAKQVFRCPGPPVLYTDALTPAEFGRFIVDSDDKGHRRVAVIGTDLRDELKTPFKMHLTGYKYHEIAEMLHEPLGTIKSRIHFARKLLKEQINRY